MRLWIAQVSDALIKLKLQTYGGLLPGIRRLSPHELAPGASDSKLVGPAFTCKVRLRRLTQLAWEC